MFQKKFFIAAGVFFGLNSSWADSGWQRYNLSMPQPQQSYLLYVTPDLVCASCNLQVPLATEAIPPALSKLPRYWASIPSFPELIFLSPQNSDATVALISAEGEVLSAVDTKAIAKLSASSGPHLEASPVTALSPAQRIKFSEMHYSGFDPVEGGTRELNKSFTESLDFSLAAALAGDAKESRMASLTLEHALALVDPAWGGVFSGGKGGKWSEIRYDKSAIAQASALTALGRAYRKYREERYLSAIKGIVDQIRNQFLPSKGQSVAGILAPTTTDAAGYFKLGDQGRKEIGAPQVVFTDYSAFLSGEIIKGLAEAYPFAPEPELLGLVRELASGLVTFDSRKTELKRLPDYIGALEGLVFAYEVTTDKSYLMAALEKLDALKDFQSAHGFASIVNGIPSKPVLMADVRSELNLAISLMRLFHYSGSISAQGYARQAFGAALQGGFTRPDEAALALEADAVMSNLPSHLTVVGPRSDPATSALFLEALRVPSSYRRVELWDKSEGGLVNPDVKYPELSKPAAFICTEKRCSLPIFSADKIMSMWDRMHKVD